MDVFHHEDQVVLEEGEQSVRLVRCLDRYVHVADQKTKPVEEYVEIWETAAGVA